MTKTLIVLSVDEEFRDLCPALTDEEKSQLRANIIAENGCHDPIIYWETEGNPIVDGYHRHEICEGEGCKYPIKGMPFPDRGAVAEWILSNQLGRRNLNDVQRKMLLGRLYKSKKGQQGGDKKSNPQNAVLIDHAEKIAKEHDTSADTVMRGEQLADDVAALAKKSPELAKAIEHKQIPASAAAKLAAAPKSILAELAKKKGPALRKAASAEAKKQTDTKPKKNGQPIGDGVFKAVYEYVGRAIPKITALNKSHPASHYERARRCIAEAMQHIENWRKSCKP